MHTSIYERFVCLRERRSSMRSSKLMLHICKYIMYISVYISVLLVALYTYIPMRVWVCAAKLVLAAVATISTALCKHQQHYNNNSDNIWRALACFNQICLCQILNPQANAWLSQLFLAANCYGFMRLCSHGNAGALELCKYACVYAVG